MRPDCYCMELGFEAGDCTCTSCAVYDQDVPESECCECVDCNCSVLVMWNPQLLDDRPLLVAPRTLEAN